MTEFIRLHAEAKQLNDRLDAIKEQLKRHAASQPRMANAVLLHAGEHAVKCGYSVRVSYNADKLASVEALLGTDPFAALFARKTTFSAVKASLDTFLASESCAAMSRSPRLALPGSAGAVRFSTTREESSAVTKYRRAGSPPFSVNSTASPAASCVTRIQSDSEARGVWSTSRGPRLAAHPVSEAATTYAMTILKEVDFTATHPL